MYTRNVVFVLVKAKTALDFFLTPFVYLKAKLSVWADEETEAQVEEKTGDGVYGKIGTESKKSMVGIKRTMDFESYG